MPKIAQGVCSKIRSWITPYNKDFEVFTTDGKVVYCNVCCKSIGCDRKSQIDLHTTTTSHVKSLALKVGQKKEKQSLLTSSNTPGKNQFFEDLCYAMVASDIPLNKLSCKPLNNFLEKYTKNIIPSESTLRNNYVPIVFIDTFEKIRQIIGGNYVYICVDETTDSRGLYIANLLIGSLRNDRSPQSFLIACKQIPKTNNETIGRFVNESLKKFFKNEQFEEKILLLLTDAAPYMIKAAKSLQFFYCNMKHITCLAHGLNRVMEKIRHMFPDANKLVNCGKKIFLKAPSRTEVYKQIMGDKPLPPDPIITRWGTWLQAALFYGENYIKFKEVVIALNDDAESIRKAKILIRKENVWCELTFILTHLSFLPKSLEDLLITGQSLHSQLKIMDSVTNKFHDIPGEKGTNLRDKLENVLGGLGTKRFCSSLDLGNYCNYIKQPGDDLEYRSCVYTCNSDGCNTAKHNHALDYSLLLITLFVFIFSFTLL